MKTKLTYISLSLLLISQQAWAAPPSTGGIPLFQIPPAPIQPHDAPTFEVEKREPMTAPAIADTKTIRVNNLKIQGQKVYDETELLAVTGFVPGTNLSLTDLRAMASKIAVFYHEKGYFLAQAYLPVQNIKDGVVTIMVVVGQYGSVTVNNQTRLSSGIVNNLMSDVDGGDLIETAPLETSLLLLSDVPGVKVNSTLVPGAEPGTSDLNVDLTPGPLVTGSIDADNAGLPATGAYRFGGTINLNNMAGLGDVASLRVLSSGPGMTYARGSYQIQAGRATVGIAYTQLDYKLGEDFTDLGVHGTAKIGSIYSSYPIIRSRDTNLYGQLGFDTRAYQDSIDIIGSVTNKRANVAMPGISGDHRDHFAGGGLSAFALTWSIGNLNIQTAAAQTIDSQTANTNGQYNKLAFNAMRLQNVFESPFSLYGAVNGQLASKNLDIWEKMELGGMYGVRAYPAGTAFGDQGYILNLEARYLLPFFSDSVPGRVQLVALYDNGSINYNKNPWAPINNSVTLSGVGGGITWSEFNDFSIKGYYARKVGTTPTTIAQSAPGQFWIQAIKYF
jgi:hemolysin activation/secretion protein